MQIKPGNVDQAYETHLQDACLVASSLHLNKELAPVRSRHFLTVLSLRLWSLA